MTLLNYLLPLLVVTSVFERFNIFIVPLDFSLKLSLIFLPIVGLILLVRRRLRFNPTFLFPFLAAVVAVEALSIPFSYDRFQSFQVVVFHLLMIGLFYLVVWSQLSQESGDRSQEATGSSLDSVVGAWGVGALAVALYGFWQFWRYLSGRSPAIFLDEILGAKSLGVATFTQSFLGRTFLRPSSTFIDTNTAASFVGIAIILGLAPILSSLRSLHRGYPADAKHNSRGLLFFGTVLTVSSAFFLMSLSRSAILGLAVGLAVFVVLNFWSAKLALTKLSLVGVATVFLLLVVSGVGYLTVSRPERMVSSVARVEYARGTIKMLQRNLLLGVGAGNFERYYTEVVAPAERFGYSHSILLTWLGETGILGLVVNLALIGAVILLLGCEALRHKVGTVWRFRISALLAGFVALVVANVFHAHYGLEFTWVLLGLAVSGYYQAKSTASSRQSAVGILGVRVDSVTMGEAVARVKEIFRSVKKGYVVTPNSEMVMLARRDPALRKILNKASLVVPDGIGVVWASRILGNPSTGGLKERVTGTDLFQELCAEAARRGGRVFLLGAREGVAERAARELKRRYPKLRIAGTFAGDASLKGDGETVAAIRSSGDQVIRKKRRPTTRRSDNPIDLLFVAYGGGKGERWIARNLKKLPVKVAMGVGGAFDFVAGEASRAPRFVRRLGFEWFYRLIKQPWRLKRQLALIPFAALVFLDSLKCSRGR